ncbi:uncharacterized protein ACN63O_005731 [Diretmus argenteus]
MKWTSVCLVAVAMLGCLSDAQYYGQDPSKPQPQPPQQAWQPPPAQQPRPVPQPAVYPQQPRPATQPPVYPQQPRPATQPPVYPQQPRPATQPPVYPQQPRPVPQPAVYPQQPRPATLPAVYPQQTRPATLPQQPRPVPQPAVYPQQTRPATLPQQPRPVQTQQAQVKQPQLPSKQPQQQYQPQLPAKQPQQQYQPPQPAKQPQQQYQPPQPAKQPQQQYQPPQPAKQPQQQYQPPQPAKQPQQQYQPPQPAKQPQQQYQPPQPAKQPQQQYQPPQPAKQPPKQPPYTGHKMYDVPSYQSQQSQQPQTSQQPKQPPQPQLPQRSQQTTKGPATEAFHSCEVDDVYKIQCGTPDISAAHCDSINCCFDGRMCYYGKAVTVQCTKDAQFIVVVARDATLPNIDLESVALLGQDQGCTPVGSTSAFAIYQFPVTSCGTVMMEEPGVIIYENRMSSSYEVGVGPLGAITRDSTYELLFQCRYIGTTIEALVIEVNLVPPPPPVAAPGPLRVDLRLGNGQCTVKGCVEEDVAYHSFYADSDYPVQKVLRQNVYVEVHMLERTDPNIHLTLGRCWATCDQNPYALPQWDLLIDGCPYRDDRYQTSLVHVDASSGLMYPTHHRRFIFRMFTFVDQTTLNPVREKVYIHCNAAVCQPSAQDNCDPRCFRQKRSAGPGAVGASKKGREETTLVTSGEIIFTVESS